MNRKIYVPDLKRRTRKALKSALFDMPLTIPEDDAECYHYNMDTLKRCLSDIGRLVDQNDCFTSRLACARVQEGLLCHFYALRLFSGTDVIMTSTLIEDIDAAIAAAKETAQ